MSAELEALAAAHGVATTFTGIDGWTRTVSEGTIRRVLTALGAAADDDEQVRRCLEAAGAAEWRRALPGTVVVRSGQIPQVALRAPGHARPRAELRTEQGEHRPVPLVDQPSRIGTLDGVPYAERTLLLPADLPLGYHRLEAHDTDAPDGAPQTATLIVAPGSCPRWEGGQPLWGWMLQLYALRSAACWGMGDLGVLRDLVRWSGRELGAGLLLCNPLHAVAPVLPQEPSPYFPTSRRFSNPLYLRIEDIPEFARLDGEAAQTVAEVAERARRLNHGDRIDRDAVFAAKQQALALVHAVPVDPARQAGLADYRRRQGTGLEDFGLFCALAERHGTPWTRWPEALHHPSSAAVTQARRELAVRVDYHVWLQWLCEEQLVAAQDEARTAGMPVGIVHDLAVGVDLGGADGWALQDELARDMTIGAPPDPFNQQGQDWRLPPLLPNRLPESGYAPFRHMLSSILRHSGGIRIDHVMGLFRLWWVPDGAGAREGTYVRYPAGDLLGVLALEASRASAVVVAEDLGTVEAGMRETMREQGMFGSAVLYFERSGPLPTPPAAYPRQALASITTHDLPPAAGFWTGAAVALQEELGLLGPDTTLEGEAARAAAERADLQEALRREGLLDDEPSLEALVTAMHAFLARSASLLAAVALGDALGDLRQPNVPGTIDQYPNWRLPLAEPRDGSASPVLLERLYDHPLLRLRAEIMRAGRAASAAGSAPG